MSDNRRTHDPTGTERVPELEPTVFGRRLDELRLEHFDRFRRRFRADSTETYLHIPREVEDEILAPLIGRSSVVEQVLALSALSCVPKIWSDYRARRDTTRAGTLPIEFGEMVTEAYLRALEACRTYDPNLGRFFPYASGKIRFGLIDFITVREFHHRGDLSIDETTGTPRYSITTIRRFSKGSDRIGDDTAVTMRDRMDRGRPLSLDREIDEDDDGEPTTLADYIADDADGPEWIAIRSTEDWSPARLDLVLEDLGIPPKDVLVLEHYLGLGGREVLSLRTIADRLGVARGTIRSSLTRTAPALRPDMTFDDLEEIHRGLLEEQKARGGDE